jgi:hypothetical protein
MSDEGFSGGWYPPSPHPEDEARPDPTLSAREAYKQPSRNGAKGRKPKRLSRRRLAKKRRAERMAARNGDDTGTDEEKQAVCWEDLPDAPNGIGPYLHTLDEEALVREVLRMRNHTKIHFRTGCACDTTHGIAQNGPCIYACVCGPSGTTCTPG